MWSLKKHQPRRSKNWSVGVIETGGWALQDLFLWCQFFPLISFLLEMCVKPWVHPFYSLQSLEQNFWSWVGACFCIPILLHPREPGKGGFAGRFGVTTQPRADISKDTSLSRTMGAVVVSEQLHSRCCSIATPFQNHVLTRKSIAFDTCLVDSFLNACEEILIA